MPARSKETGSTLIASLGVTAALAVLASASVMVAVSSHQRSTLLSTREISSEAVLSVASLALLDLSSRATPTPIDTLFSVTHDGIRYDIALWSPHGRVDINTAPPSLIGAALRAANIANADTIADQIQDWRDPDDLRSLRGAERREYDRAGLPPPLNRAFRSTDELASVLGLAGLDLTCLAEHVTVSSLESAPETGLANRRLRRALGADGGPPAAILLEPGTVLGMQISDRNSNTTWQLLVRLTDQGTNPMLVQDLRRMDQSCAGEMA